MQTAPYLSYSEQKRITVNKSDARNTYNGIVDRVSIAFTGSITTRLVIIARSVTDSQIVYCVEPIVWYPCNAQPSQLCYYKLITWLSGGLAIEWPCNHRHTMWNSTNLPRVIYMAI